MVEGIKKCSVFADQSSLCSGRTGIDAQVDISLITCQILHRNLVFVMAVFKLPEIILGREKRLQTLYLKIHLDMIRQTLLQLNDRDIQIFFRVQRRSHRRKEVGVFRRNRMLVVQIQSPDKGFPELRKEMKRTAQKCDVPPDRLSTCQSTDGLIDHRLENGSSQVFFRGSIVDERLNTPQRAAISYKAV